MNHIVLIAAIGLLPTTTVFARTVSAPLIVVEDRGGDSALPYYQSLNPQPDQATPPAPMPAPRAGNTADAEAAMLPVRSTQLSPGEVQRRVIRAPGLTALFLIGDDERSRARGVSGAGRHRHDEAFVAEDEIGCFLRDRRRLDRHALHLHRAEE